jgi:hypothetical protein
MKRSRLNVGYANGWAVRCQSREDRPVDLRNAWMLNFRIERMRIEIQR